MTPAELAAANALIVAGKVECADGHRPAVLDDALVSEGGEHIYPIRDKVVVMESSESIEMKS